MSAIAGTVARRGGSARTEKLSVLVQALAGMREGPAERRSAVDSVAMAVLPSRAAGRDADRGAPFRGDDGSLVAFEGRLDNHAILCRQFAGTTPSSPAALALAVYRRDGVAGFAALVGDFSLALWDSRNACLVLAVDGLGRRPLYYRYDAESLWWASAARPLLAVDDAVRAVDEEYVADFLAGLPSSRSPFRGIGRVPGGHAAVVSETGVEIQRYWRLDAVTELRYRCDTDYEEHFAEVFAEAVACRADDADGVWCELSGGLDSSSIACMAHRAIHTGRVQTPWLKTVSYVFDVSAGSNERDHIDVIERHLGQSGLHVLESEHALFDPLPPSFEPDTPSRLLCFMSRGDHTAKAMFESGSSVLLSGIGGDQVFMSQPDLALPIADLVAKRDVLGAIRYGAEWCGPRRLPIASTLTGAVWTAVRSIRRRQPAHDATSDGDWFHPEFAKRVDLAERMTQGTPDGDWSVPSRATQCAYIERASRIYALEPCASVGYVDMRYPYLDRRLAEFAVALPLDQKVRPRESRSIVRRGLRGIVPDVIRYRRDKAGPDEAMFRAMSRAGCLADVVRDPRVCAYGFVERGRFADTLARARHGVSVNQADLLSTLALEAWLRTLDPRREGAYGAAAPPGWRQCRDEGEINDRNQRRDGGRREAVRSAGDGGTRTGGSAHAGQRGLRA